MSDPSTPHERAREFFEGLWRQGDPWDLETSPFEQRRFHRVLGHIAGRQYPYALEIGCGTGAFTRLLAPSTGHLVAFDVSGEAITRATRAGVPSNVEYRVANAMDVAAERVDHWDLIVFSETICYLGWLYSFFDVGWLAWTLHRASRPGGRLVLANTHGEIEDWLVRTWLIRTYRDLFVNVGYRVVAEASNDDVNKGCHLQTLISVLERPAAGRAGD